MSNDAAREPGSEELTDGFHLLLEALEMNGIDTMYGLLGIPVTEAIVSSVFVTNKVLVMPRQPPVT